MHTYSTLRMASYATLPLEKLSSTWQELRHGAFLPSLPFLSVLPPSVSIIELSSSFISNVRLRRSRRRRRRRSEERRLRRFLPSKDGSVGASAEADGRTGERPLHCGFAAPLSPICRSARRPQCQH